mgnify:CR=1 FL=1
MHNIAKTFFPILLLLFAAVVTAQNGKNNVGNAQRIWLDSEFGDFEDAIQYFSALQNRKIEAIVTRNVKDFKLSTLPVLQPSELLV